MERISLNYLKWGMVFTFLNIHIGRWNLLPDFVGMLLFYLSIESHARQNPVEERLKPLLLMLAADYFLHWIWQFENSLESLLALIISIYVIYVLLGEVAGRIRENQLQTARQIEFMRVWMVLLMLLAFLTSPYGHEMVNVGIMFGVVGGLIVLMIVLQGIVPEESAETGRV